MVPRSYPLQVVMATACRWLLAVSGLLCLGCQPAAAPKSQPPAPQSPVTAQTPDAEPIKEEVPDEPAVVAASPAPEPVYRPNDDHPEHDAAALAALGIHEYRSDRLTLWTDIAPDKAATLPPLVDAFYEQLVTGLGPLPPARDGQPLHLYGYLMTDEARFREAGCLPEDLPTFEHGRNRHNVFWMREQPFDYYRAHLLLHEVTHCYMLAPTHTEQYPVWVMEGLAEFFATHRLTETGQLQTGVMPDSPEAFAGFGRITLIRKAVAEGRGRTVGNVVTINPAEFADPEAYAWSWAFCHFLLTHPHYGTLFREAVREAGGNQFAAQLAARFQAVERDLLSEWMLFMINLTFGYDTQRAAIDFQPGTPAGPVPREVEVRADRGWQSTGVRVEAGKKCELKAHGLVTLATTTKPWTSGPAGISFRYHDGWPIGRLLVCLRQEEGLTGGDDDSLRRVLPVGDQTTFTAPVSGTLYLRVNDSWNSLHDNQGAYTVTVRSTD